MGNELPSPITCHSNKLGGCTRTIDGGQISSVGILTFVFIPLIRFSSNLAVGFNFCIGIVDMEYVLFLPLFEKPDITPSRCDLRVTKAP